MWVNQAEAARRLGKTPSQMSNWKTGPVEKRPPWWDEDLVRESDGKTQYEIEGLVYLQGELGDRVRGRPAKKPPEPDGIEGEYPDGEAESNRRDSDEQLARYRAVQADIKELEREQLEVRLVPVDDVNSLFDLLVAQWQSIADQVTRQDEDCGELMTDGTARMCDIVEAWFDGLTTA